MSKETLRAVITMGISLVLAVAGILLRKSGVKAIAASAEQKPKSKKKTFGTVLAVIGIWLFTVTLLPLIFGKGHSEGFHVAISPDKMQFFGMEISSTIVITWAIMAIVVVLALILRIFVVPRMKQVPRGIQNVLELSVDGIRSYVGSKAHGLGEGLCAYLFTIAIFLVFSAATELIGVRAPTADLTMTLGLAFLTFILINYYGIRQKGLGGRVKSLASPTPVVFPFRIISDIAIPISMACRLFGNMLGGLIVMELLYSALGSSAIGIPSVIGLYFNVFHPIIQAFIFVTLTLTFIGEATE